jgi:isopropylmalate/citramalate/homocitrate synthase-like protein
MKVTISDTGRIRIFDTTLRDGEQTPGASLTPEEKLVIARQLDRLGVDAIEAGTPVTSKGEFEALKLISAEGLRAEVYGLARVIRGDIDAVADAGGKYVHLFIATSDVHLQQKLRITREQAVERSLEAIDYAKSRGLRVEFSAEDATRTDIDFLKKIYKAVEEAGVIRINIPDTVGIMTPHKMHGLVMELKQVLNVPLSVHCHNDFGMAVANTLAGLEAGADQAHVTVNGLGERAGNAALEEVVVALNLLYGRKTRIDTTLLYQTSQLVSKLTGIVVQPNKAVVGDNAFTHISGIHTHGLIAHPLTYEPIPPDLVGRRRRFIAGKHAGTHGIRAELEQMGVHPSDSQLKEIVGRVKEIGDRGRTVTDTELLAIAREIMGIKAEEGKQPVQLVELAVMTGTKMTPTASVRLLINGREFTSAETGVGPVDAAVRAIQKVTTDLINVRLKEYRLEALTGGSDAVAEVVIRVEDRDGNEVSARAAREDIVKASVEAMINGINRLLLQKSQR